MITTLKPKIALAEGITQQLVLDSEGRITLPQPIQELLGIAPGEKLSYILADGVLMLLPKGMSALSLVARASSASPNIDQWQDNSAAIEEELTEIRAQVVREIYGDEFMDELERNYGHLVGTALTAQDDTKDRE